MKAYSLVAPTTVNSRPLGLADWRLYAFSALFALGNLLVPLALHAVPNAGQVFLPMFFFTLLAAWQFGPLAGLAVAVASPLLNHALSGMPVAAMLPVVLSKSVVLALAASLLSLRTRAVSLPGILAAVLAMQAAGFAAERLAGLPLEASWAMIRLAVPGMLIMLLAGFAVLRLLNRFLDAGRGEGAAR
jgi:hypothetical protein